MIGSDLAPRLIAVFLSVLVLSGGSGAAMSADEPVLTIAGIGGADGTEISLTVEELREMGADEIQTGTPWTDGRSTFTGVTGRRLVEALRADGTEVNGSALHQYPTTLPFDDFHSASLLLAYPADGQPLSLRRTEI